VLTNEVAGHDSFYAYVVPKAIEEVRFDVAAKIRAKIELYSHGLLTPLERYTLTQLAMRTYAHEPQTN
jgi:hypothetical protein